MPTPADLRRWDREIVWHAFTQMAEYEPLLIERAEGCTLIDIDGNRYIDGVSSLWCNVHGHRHPKIDAAIRSRFGLSVNFAPKAEAQLDLTFDEPAQGDLLEQAA